MHRKKPLFCRKAWYKAFTFSTISREYMLVIQVTRNRPRFSRLFLSCNLRHDLLSPNYGAKMQNVKDYKEKFRGRKQWFWKSAKVLSGAELFTIWCKFSTNFHICTGPDPCRHKETKCDKWVMSNHNFSILKNNRFLDSWRPPEILDGWTLEGSG